MIALPAELTLDQASAVLAQLESALAAEEQPTLDASALIKLDSSAVAVLLQCQRTASAQGKRLKIIGTPPKLDELAKLYGVAELIGI